MLTLRLLRKNLQEFTFYKSIILKETDGTEYKAFEEIEHNFTGHITNTLSANKINLYGKEVVDMASIITNDEIYPNKGDKIIINDIDYVVLSTMIYTSHITIDCKVKEYEFKHIT